MRIYISPAAVARMTREELEGAKLELWRELQQKEREIGELSELIALVEERLGEDEVSDAAA